MIFRGTFEHALDAKHRLTVPAKFRAALADGVVLAFLPELEEGSARSLSVWPSAEYDAFASAALEGMHPIAPRAQFLRSALYGNAFDLDLDSAYRLVIPQPAREFAGLGKDVVVSGAGQSFQIWDRQAFAGHNAGILARFHEIAASFDHTD